MDNLTAVIPFYNGHDTIGRLLDSLPANLPVIVVDDQSDEALSVERDNVTVIQCEKKGYFTGAVNAGLEACLSPSRGKTDVLILNQDAWLEGSDGLNMLADNRAEYGLIGERIAGQHPAWARGYIHGTFMFIRRDVIKTVGRMNEADYPLWGSTCEYQLRACRAGFKVLPIAGMPGLRHERRQRYGSAITEILKREPENKDWFIRTPPAVSVIVPCHNHGQYLPDLLGSLIGGPTCLGDMPGQTFASFELIIVDDASTDDTPQIIKGLVDGWKGIRSVRRDQRGGTAAANNSGIEAAFGKYITILGADDMMEPDRLERLYRASEENPHSMVYDDMHQFADGQRTKGLRMQEYDFEALLFRNQLHAGIMFERQAWKEVGGYPELMAHGREDWAFNVALGVAGYCGVHVDYDGYLYRREGQNRTLTNTAPDWHEYFLNQLIALFPEIYAGERPMSCCGGRRKRTPARSSKAAAASIQAPLPGRDGMTLLEYIGGNVGLTSWWGPKTQTRYEFGGTKPVGYVDNADVEGMLMIRLNGDKPAFRRYKRLPARVVEPPAPIVEPALPTGPEKQHQLDAPDPGEMIVREINQLLAKEALSPAQLEQMLQAETDGKARKMVIAALQGAL